MDFQGRALWAKLFAGLLVATLGAMALAASHASATACSFAGGAMNIDTQADAGMGLRVDPASSDIELFQGNFAGPEVTPCAGGQPTLTNTVSVTITDAANNELMLVDLTNGLLAPGTGGAAEAGAPEIEFTVNGGAGNDQLTFTGTALADNFTFGTQAVGQSANLNGDDDVNDLTLMNTETLLINGGEGDDVFSTNGGAGFTGPLASGFGPLSGDGGNDRLTGNTNNNSLTGGAGDDTLAGLAGNDTLTGGTEIDTLDYSNGSASGITVDVGVGGAQATGGAGTDTIATVENVTGSPFGDNLTGSTGSNRIVGLGGVDTITLLAGADFFDAYDGGLDTVDCGGGGDSGIADEAGVDTLTNCDSTNNAPQTTIASGPAEGATVTGTSATYGLAASEAATFAVSVDGGAFQGCAASCVVALSPGAHTLSFRATDASGLTDLTPATRNVTIAAAASAATPTPTQTGQRAAALKKCKKKRTKSARRKCRKRASSLPV